MTLIRAFNQLTKAGIILFAVVSALAGYAVSFHLGQVFDPLQPVLLVVGLYLVAGGGFALNQAQEWKIDARMDRTRKRPIPSGRFAPWQGYAVGGLMSAFGLLVLLMLGPWPAGLALLTLFLYNVVYTMLWKPQWVFGAVPGAIPGAVPVVIGFSVNTPQIWRPECVYLFLVLFLWQMPHFWSLAIRFREDYKQGGFPVLPVTVGVNRALYHVGLYVFAYVGVALTAPFFLQAHLLYLMLVLPISLKVLWEFFKYFQAKESRAWLPFFLWTNLSLLIYLAVPVMDKWLYWVLNYA
ncbi:MAG TPA: protoheme IX farnesyltransferase [Bdellovibrionales bacterium]|nr:protoheme IX farnesyltransferase [Bdellovibrionales bacterium]